MPVRGSHASLIVHDVFVDLLIHAGEFIGTPRPRLEVVSLVLDVSACKRTIILSSPARHPSPVGTTHRWAEKLGRPGSTIRFGTGKEIRRDQVGLD
jgi:hypothetical protein